MVVRNIIVSVLFGGTLLVGGAASSQRPSGRFAPLRREPLLAQQLPPGSPAARIVEGARIVFAPGQPTGLHRHPVTVAGVVTQGEFTFQIEGHPVRLLRTGDAFTEPAGAVIERFDNASSLRPAEIVAFDLTDSAARPLIQMLSPRPRHGG